MSKELWTEYFPFDESVEWDAFWNILRTKHSRVSDEDSELMRMVLSPKESDRGVVTSSSFDRAARFFGPDVDRWSIEMRKMFEKRFFHGSLSKDAAQRLLSQSKNNRNATPVVGNHKKSNNPWLVRFSPREGQYAVSVMDEHGTMSENFVTVQWKAASGKPVFRSLLQGTEHDTIEGCLKDLGLDMTACVCLKSEEPMTEVDLSLSTTSARPTSLPAQLSNPTVPNATTSNEPQSPSEPFICLDPIQSSSASVASAPPGSGTSQVDSMMIIDYFFAQNPAPAPPAHPAGRSPSSSLHEKMREELTCSICLELFRDPRKLTCDHVFCRACLGKLVGSTSQVRCPECRSITYLCSHGVYGVDGLPQERRVKRLVASILPTVASIESPSQPEMDDSASSQDGDRGNGPARGVDYIQVSRQQVAEEFTGFVPFWFGPRDCMRKFEEWKRSLWLVPTDFVKESSGLIGLMVTYVPFYCFSLTTSTSYQATVLVADPHRSKLNQHPPCDFPSNYVQAATVSINPHQQPPEKVPSTGPHSNPGTSTTSTASSRTGYSASSSNAHPAAQPNSFRFRVSRNTEEKWVKGAVGTVVSTHLHTPHPRRSATSATAKGITSSAATIGKQVKKVFQGFGWVDGKGVGMTGSSPSSASLRSRSEPAMPDSSQRLCDIAGTHENAYINLLVCGAQTVRADLLNGLRSSFEDDPDFIEPLHVTMDSPQSSSSSHTTTTTSHPAASSGSSSSSSGGTVSGTISASSSQPKESEYAIYLKAVENSVFKRPPFSHSLCAGSTREDHHASDDEQGPTEDDFEGVEWPREGSSGGAMGDAEPTGAPPKQSLISADTASHQVWGSGVWEKVKEAETEFARNLLKSNKAYRNIMRCDIRTALTSLDYTCILVPMFLGHYVYDSKTYDVVIHGRSGVVSAHHPWVGETYLKTLSDYTAFHKGV